ncbi:hypothetical protein [Leptospira haakeii]|uniref:Lipoprotein n=1 Tax=Leptospira haakeii TaxID=2023198 RepID=A0ABX4PKT9_9LEPT|nr:hypothetical protein [Leptospira haakeii]PKA14659.1 hypothetical protein CH363_17300 [Leptospira haakeii]PKA19037.1 hypothetical protein CH377_14555 [Leptospira haakeii]
MKKFLKDEKFQDILLKTALLIVALLLIVLLSTGCNNAKAVSIDASSSAIGAIAFDGNIGVFGSNTPGPSLVKVNVIGYLNKSGKEMNLILTNTDTSETQTLQISANGTFSFPDTLDPGTNFTIDLGTYTGGQNCTLTGDSGKAGLVAASKIDCERNLAVFGTWFSGSVPIMNLYQVNQKTSTVVGTPMFFSTSAGLPMLDLVWSGNKYLAVWTPTGNTIKARFLDIEQTTIGSDITVSGTISTAPGAKISTLSAAYNADLDEFVVVFVEFGGSTSFSNLVRYIRIHPDGTLIGTPTTIKSVLGTIGSTFGYSDVIWDGSKYATAFEFHDNDTDDAPNNYLAVYSFTNGAATQVNQLFLASGTGSTGAIFPVSSAGAAYPKFIRTSSDVWLFFNRSNMGNTDNTIDSSLMEWRNLSGVPAQIRRDTNPNGCNPNGAGFQTYVPSPGNLGSRVLMGYDLRCTQSGSLFFDVYHSPMNSSSGALGAITNYSGSTLGQNFTLGSSTTCRTSRCYTSAGALGDGVYILDPNFDGSTHTFYSIKLSSPGNSVDFPVQTSIQ